MPFLFFVFYIFTSTSFASVEVAVSMVPRGRLVDTIGRDFIVKTPLGTKIEIGFDRSGDLKVASGRNLNKGDDLEPGEGLISLSSIAQKVQALGIRPEGFWNLENDRKHGWIYELNAKHLINAKTGELLVAD